MLWSSPAARAAMIARAAFISVIVLLGSFADAAAAGQVYEVVSKPSLLPGTPLPEPTGPVVLRVDGLIAAPGGKSQIAFDMPMLEQLGLVRYTTPTNWSDGPITFEGVLLSSVLKVAGAKSGAKTLLMTALNDYQAPVPVVDADTWPVMLAIKENGQYMSIREHGPLWVVYPQHAFPELGSREYLSRWVWQLRKITVQ